MSVFHVACCFALQISWYYIAKQLISDRMLAVLIVFRTTCYEVHRIKPIWYELHRVHPMCYEPHRINALNLIVFKTTRYELNRIISSWTKLHVGILMFSDKEWNDASCRNTIGHRWVDKRVQFAALRRQVAPLVFTDYWAPMNVNVDATYRPHRILGIDEWKNKCLPSSGKLHLQHLPFFRK